MSSGKKRRQPELRHVGILKLIDADVAEFVLIVFPCLLIFLQKLYRLHDDVVKIQCVRRHQLFLIFFVHGGNPAVPEILNSVFLFVLLRRDQLVLCPSDLVHHALYRQRLFFKSQLLHRRRQRCLGIRRVVHREVFPVAEAPAPHPQDAHTDRVKGSRPHAFCNLRVLKRGGKTAFDLVCRLVGKGNGKHIPRGAGGGNELR